MRKPHPFAKNCYPSGLSLSARLSLSETDDKELLAAPALVPLKMVVPDHFSIISLTVTILPYSASPANTELSVIDSTE